MRQTYAHYDFTQNSIQQVPFPTLPHVEFCDLARAAFAAVRQAIGLPSVAAVFEWAGRDGMARGSVVTEHEPGSRRLINLILTELCFVHVNSGDDGQERIAHLADMVAAMKPRAFGPLMLPLDTYYHARLVSPVDGFSLRAIHAWADGQWITRLDVLLAPQEVAA